MRTTGRYFWWTAPPSTPIYVLSGIQIEGGIRWSWYIGSVVVPDRALEFDGDQLVFNSEFLTHDNAVMYDTSQLQYDTEFLFYGA